MEEELTALYTNIDQAKSAMSSLKNSGINKAYMNTTEFGLHIGIDPKEVVKKFPGAFPSTLVKVVVNVDPENKDNAISLLENTFGVLDK